jgi:hypothetical protein
MSCIKDVLCKEIHCNLALSLRVIAQPIPGGGIHAYLMAPGRRLRRELRTAYLGEAELSCNGVACKHSHDAADIWQPRRFAAR